MLKRIATLSGLVAFLIATAACASQTINLPKEEPLTTKAITGSTPAATPTRPSLEDLAKEGKLVLSAADTLKYRQAVTAYTVKLRVLDKSLTWERDGAIGVGATSNGRGGEMIALGDGRSYEMYVEERDRDGDSMFFFRSVATKQDASATDDFPRERVIFSYDRKNDLGAIEYRRYAAEGGGEPAIGKTEAVAAFNRYLSKADAIVAGAQKARR